jgi:Flp pilus assembly protein TadD
MSRGALFALIFAASLYAQKSAEDFLKQAQALSRDGKPDDAVPLYRAAAQVAPNSYAANSGAGVALDLAGNYAEARQYFTKAIAMASGADKIRALRDMALSYGFEGNCRDAVPFDKQAYDLELAAKDFYNAGEVADELARICIDSGDLSTAAQWYKTGYEAGLQEPDIQPDRKDLWEFRWEHAQARLAARSGNMAAARAHVASAQAILAKGDNPRQAPFLPYLLGYVAFYAADYKTALEQFQKANQDDAFIQAMLAQTYEKLGDADRAKDCYRKALGFFTHNPPVAYARPLAKRKMGK